jgi:hypothetical protein
MTPEKLQGVTLEFELFISILKNWSPQVLYVAFSRVRDLNKLILTEDLTMEYIRNFLPPKAIIDVTKTMLGKIDVPKYIPIDERVKFEIWLEQQIAYSNEASQLRTTLRGAR